MQKSRSLRSGDREGEQVGNFFTREDLAQRCIVIANDLLHRRAPPLDDGADSLLERALVDELEDLNDTSLPDAVNSIGARADVSFRSRRHARHSFPESRAVEYFFAVLAAWRAMS